LLMVVGIATASTAGWIQAVVGRGERASPGWCDRGSLARLGGQAWWAVRWACGHWGTCAAGQRPGASGRWQAADFEQLEAERLELGEHAVQCRAVRQRPGQYGVAAARPGLQGGECGAYRLAQVAADADTVPVRRRVVGCAGHVLTTRGGDPPAGGCTVVGTC